MTIFSWYGINNDSTMVIANNDLPLYYNYLDTAGTILSEKRYKDCLPFHGNKAWAKEEEAKDYILIDKNGEQVGKKAYEFVRTDKNGFHICANEYYSRFLFFTNTYEHCFLFDDKNELLHKGYFSSIFLEDGAYYGVKGEKTILIYQLPIDKKQD